MPVGKPKKKIPHFVGGVIWIRQKHRVRVPEHRGCLVERDAVLPHVRFRLPRIPFEDVSQFGSSCFLRLADPNVPNALAVSGAAKPRPLHRHVRRTS